MARTTGRFGFRLVSLLLLLTLSVGCEANDDPAGRDRAVALVKQGALEEGESASNFVLPPDLAHTSEGGEITVRNDDGGLVIIFYRFRGLNHYTGWVYSERPLEDEPSGIEPVVIKKSDRPNWYDINAG